MKKIKIGLTEEQLRLISQSLDFYSRIGIGQFSAIKDHLTFDKNIYKIYCEEHVWIPLKDVKLSTDYNQYDFIRNIVDTQLNVARNTLYGDHNYHKNGHWGINNYNVDETSRKAYDIHQDIRYYFWKNSENRSSY